MWALGVDVTFWGWTFIFIMARPNWQYSGNDWRAVSIILATRHLANSGWNEVQHNAVPNNNNVFRYFYTKQLKSEGDSNLQPLDHALPLSYTDPYAVYLAWSILHKMYEITTDFICFCTQNLWRDVTCFTDLYNISNIHSAMKAKTVFIGKSRYQTCELSQINQEGDQ